MTLKYKTNHCIYKKAILSSTFHYIIKTCKLKKIKQAISVPIIVTRVYRAPFFPGAWYLKVTGRENDRVHGTMRPIDMVETGPGASRVPRAADGAQRHHD